MVMGQEIVTVIASGSCLVVDMFFHPGHPLPHNIIFVQNYLNNNYGTPSKRKYCSNLFGKNL